MSVEALVRLCVMCVLLTLFGNRSDSLSRLCIRFPTAALLLKELFLFVTGH